MGKNAGPAGGAHWHRHHMYRYQGQPCHEAQRSHRVLQHYPREPHLPQALLPLRRSGRSGGSAPGSSLHLPVPLRHRGRGSARHGGGYLSGCRDVRAGTAAEQGPGKGSAAGKRDQLHPPAGGCCTAGNAAEVRASAGDGLRPDRADRRIYQRYGALYCGPCRKEPHPG